MTAQLTPQALEAIGASGECNGPIFRMAPAVGCEVRKSLNARMADLLRPFLKPGQKVIWREPFRWFDDNGVMSNHYDGMSIARLAEDFGYEYDWELSFEHAAIVWPKAALAATGEHA
ncbi:hypothetical protein J2X90_000739 [Variovorax paradoxus]|uniref:hypothetical protein n=1 Tax=Variovorax paradoxus TaxID=34073 RepID=UPI00277D5A2D|nr:hypothetical protein [Variovorax paradoxus]MDQ0022953.1 hypothetical protein [Variovorax paradoxus]